ncbi:hypothetical protein TIFTF001_051076 [Ficus carica]|uniref:Uncharacterized protein n=1 Tax=Ficus carica TaxID=3494 RepID=A0AA87YQN3_FICCA|nr:hypothetical protein TIFTF001_051076 [Ficus carica]
MAKKKKKKKKMKMKMKMKKLQVDVIIRSSALLLSLNYCPKLKRVTCLDRDPCPPSLDKVYIDDDLWESLEWNHPNAKDAVESVR